MYSGRNRLQKIKDIQELKTSILDLNQFTGEDIEEVYIFGTKELGDKAYNACMNKGIKIKGYIDNNKSIQDTYHNGVKVFSLENVLPIQNKTYIIIATLTYWREIEKQLQAANVKQYIPYPILSIWDNEQFPAADLALEGILEDLINNKDKYIELYEVFEDEISRLVLDYILEFRLSFNTEYLVEAQKLSETDGEEYFNEKIIQLNENEVFVDGGAYKGETTQRFIEKVSGQYKEIYLFEPDKDLIDEARKNLSNYPEIKYIEAAVGEENSLMYFKSTGGLGGCISNQGEEVVQVRALDEVIDNEVTFIKLDIEGAESAALKGAKRLIKYNEPKLAISGYHKAPDLWKIIAQVKDISAGYKVYLRHHTNSCFGTDLYFV